MKARKLLTSVEHHNAAVIARRASTSQERLGQWRASIGYGIFGCLCLVFFTLIADCPW